MLQLRSQLAPETRAAFAALYRLSWPVVMSRLGFMLMGLMDTLVVDPFRKVMPEFFGLTLQELIAAKHPTAWVRFERAELVGCRE